MKRRISITVGTLLFFLWLPGSLAQEGEAAPSKKSNMEVQGGEQMSKAKLAETLEGKKVGNLAEEPLQSEPPQVSPKKKRDPFQPFTARIKRPEPRTRKNLSPLEQYEIGQLKLVGIVWDIAEPQALVEDTTGLGYVVKVGTPIGPNEGKVTTINPEGLIVEEIHVDYYGVRKTREVKIQLPGDSQ